MDISQVMKRKLALFLLVAVSLPAVAAPPTQESLETLFRLTNSEASLVAIYETFDAQMRSAAQPMLDKSSTTTDQRMALFRGLSRAKQLIRTEFTVDTVHAQFNQIYSEVFTQEEVDGLIAFYSSPAGKAFVAKMPIVTSKSMQIGQSQVERFLPKLMAILLESVK
jgi:hypothetical protein